eukprot:scaffold423078_cov29-Prasinocladus_malaysianus.AAC.1
MRMLNASGVECSDETIEWIEDSLAKNRRRNQQNKQQRLKPQNFSPALRAMQQHASLRQLTKSQLEGCTGSVIGEGGFGK